MISTTLSAEVASWFTAQKAATDVAEHARLISVLDKAIVTEVPEFGADPSLRAALSASTGGAVSLYPGALYGGDPGTILPTAEMLELARTMALRRLELGLLLRAYRVGQRVFWQDLMKQVNASELRAIHRAEALEVLWDRLSQVLELFVEQAAAAFLEENEQVLRGTLTRRREWVEAILAGEQRDANDATVALGHRVSLYQTGLVVWAPTDGPGTRTTESLENLARHLAEDLGAAPPLILPAGSRRLWAWIATPAKPDLNQLVLLDGAARAGWRVAVGAPAPGIDGFRATHRTALRAERVAALTPEVGVTRYHDVELLSMLSDDLTALSAMVRNELGGLAGADALAARLRETVRVYLDCRSSAKAAERLHIHKNTVLYRMQQAEQLLGRPVDELGLPAHVALLVMAAYGPDWLTRPGRDHGTAS